MVDMIVRFSSAGLLALALLAPGAASAASCQSAFGMASLSDQDAFKADPWTILNNNPTGGGKMARETRELVLADTGLHEAVLSLAAASNPDQQAAFGSGLGQAAMACTRTDPQIAQQIQMSVLSRGTPALVEAFRTVTGEITTTAVGTGAAAGAASAGLAGTNSSVIGGGTNQAGSGVAQNAPATTSFASATPVSITRVAAATTSSTPTPTTPGPMLGEGLLALILTAFGGVYFLRRRSSTAA